jgi:ketosteroid isomerase-like protein
MTTHPHTELLKKFYDCFAKGDTAGMLEYCSDDVTFQIAGKSKLAGKYTKTTVGPELMLKIRELSDGTFKLEIHDIMASDQHGMVLTSDSVMRKGVKHEYRSVHVWRIQKGKLLAWYEYPRDLYQYDTVWS